MSMKNIFSKKFRTTSLGTSHIGGESESSNESGSLFRAHKRRGASSGKVSAKAWAMMALLVLVPVAVGGALYFIIGGDKEAPVDVRRSIYGDADDGDSYNYSSQGGILEMPFLDSLQSTPYSSMGPWFSIPQLKTKSYTIKENDNLSSVLNNMGVPYDTILEWCSLAEDKYDFARVKPGQSFCLWSVEGDDFIRFEFDINSREQLVISLDETGKYCSSREFSKKDASYPIIEDNFPVPAWTDPETGYNFYRGNIHANFYNSALKAGMTPSKIMIMIKVFSDVNFGRDLREGDEFSVVTAPGEYPGDEGPILAAMLEVRGKPRYMYRFEEGDDFGYYNEDGKSPKRSRFICPLRYKRISSVFTYRRLHPILKRYRPHLGVDFAAPTGTPIKAAADGVVSFVGRKGGFGNSVIVSHNGDYQTMYNHLSKFAGGMKRGKRVKQGDVIAYCGSTGLSTGPHLDYRIFHKNKAVNPLKVTSMAGTPVKSMSSFKKSRDKIKPELARGLPMGPPRILPMTEESEELARQNSASGQ